MAFLTPLNDVVFTNFLSNWITIRLASGFFDEINAKWGVVQAS
jgi:hypothetical protein